MSELTETRRHTQASAVRGAEDAPQPQLFLVLERARPLQGGARHSLANIDRVALGRGASRAARRFVDAGTRTLAVTIPDGRVSSAHALLERDGARWTFTDRASTNGSWVNGRRVESAPLADGDRIEIGQTLFRFRAAVTTPANASGDVDSTELEGLLAHFGTLLPWLARDLETVARVARSDVSTLLLGETGTGKEVLARAIHAESRRPGAFAAVNCGALPAPLVESLLFGHKKGAFSGATQDETGFVRAAEGGTLFLDEIGDLPKPSQAALLRVLQEREVVPVGATRPVPVDVRVVAATHRPLASLVEAGEFRSDLYARLSAFTYSLPPLRARLDDLGLLLATLLRKVSGERAASLTLSGEAAQLLLAHTWPLNVRELEQCLKVAAVLADGARIEASKLPIAAPPAARDSQASSALAQTPSLSQEEEALRQELVSQLKEHRGNVTRVGQAMGKARTQVQRWVKRFGLHPTKFR